MLQDVTEAEQSIEYLNRQINSTSLADLQFVFFTLIKEQTKTIMLARVSPECMLRTVDPAGAPEQKVRPRRSMICFFGLFLGGLVGIILVLARNGIATERE